MRDPRYVTASLAVSALIVSHVTGVQLLDIVVTRGVLLLLVSILCRSLREKPSRRWVHKVKHLDVHGVTNFHCEVWALTWGDIMGW